MNSALLLIHHSSFIVSDESNTHYERVMIEMIED